MPSSDGIRNKEERIAFACLTWSWPSALAFLVGGCSSCFPSSSWSPAELLRRFLMIFFFFFFFLILFFFLFRFLQVFQFLFASCFCSSFVFFWPASTSLTRFVLENFVEDLRTTIPSMRRRRDSLLAVVFAKQQKSRLREHRQTPRVQTRRLREHHRTP